jgi:hypothetical protein
MKNSLLLLFVVFNLVSCKKFDQEIEPELVKKQTFIDTVENSDKDENGCLTSAGYVWSQLNKECVKIYQSAIILYPYANQTNEDETLNAYVVFSKEGGNEAEIFFPNTEKSHLFIRETEGQPWKYQDWQLIPWKGFILKKGEEIKFSGDGEFGPKVTGSDKIEN